MSIRHVGIVVNNLDKMVKFYKLLGFEKFYETEIHGDLIEELIGLDSININIVKLRSIRDGTIIELLKYKRIHNWRKKSRLYEQGLSHLAITVNNIDSIYEILKLNSIDFISPPLLTDDNVKVCFCRDWEGNFIEIVEELKDKRRFSWITYLLCIMKKLGRKRNIQTS